MEPKQDALDARATHGIMLAGVLGVLLWAAILIPILLAAGVW